MKRKCCDCGKIKTLDNFYKSKREKLGVIGYCKQCFNKRNKKNTIIYDKKHKKEINAKHKIWWNALSDERKKKYQYLKTKEERREYYFKLKNTFIKKYGFSYSIANLFGLSLVINIYKKFNNVCYICKSNKRLCIHHIDGIGYSNYKKLNKKVNNVIENLLLVCTSCHMKIHDNCHNGKYKKII